MSDISSMEMFHYLTGEVTKVRADEIDAHLATCQTCRGQVDQLKGMIDRLDEPDDEFESVDLPAMVRKKVENHRSETDSKRRSLPSALGIVAALVVAVAAAGYWIATQGTDEGFRAKSSGALIPEQDRWVALEAYRLDETGQPGRLSPGVEKGDYFLFAYTNLGEQPKMFLMIFALDSQGSVHWFHPAYTDESVDPGSIAIEGNVTGKELPEKVRHSYAPGQLWIYGLFTSEPVNVSAVEAMLAGLIPGDKLPIADSAQHILTTVVKP